MLDSDNNSPIRRSMVVYIELEPNLSNSIETLVKEEYRQTLNRILKEKVEDEQLFERLEVLRLFLESTDFSYLRSQYEKYLTEGKRIRFKIHSIAKQGLGTA